MWVENMHAWVNDGEVSVEGEWSPTKLDAMQYPHAIWRRSHAQRRVDLPTSLSTC